MKNGETPGFPRFTSLRRYPGLRYKTHGDGWRLDPGQNGVHGRLYLQGVGYIPIREKDRCPYCGTTCGRDDNTARVLLRELEKRLAGASGPGREPPGVWSGGSFAPMKHETHAMAV